MDFFLLYYMKLKVYLLVCVLMIILMIGCRKSQQTTQKIDVVFTWVDTTDPTWMKKKNKYLKVPMKDHDLRYISFNEIEYAVKSVIKNMKWVNHIYIVTDNHIPEFLKEMKSRKISLIYHDTIIPNNILPTFNSLVIESYLHKIPTLTENFVYMNDDMFIWSEVAISDFLTKDNKIKHYGTSLCKLQINSNSTAYQKSWKNACDMLKTDVLRPWHHAVMCKKSVLSQFEHLFKKCNRSKFREAENVPPIGFSCIQNVLLKKAIQQDQFPLSRYVGCDKLNSQNFAKIKKELMEKKYKFVCLNNITNESWPFIKSILQEKYR